jgi:hypothetical protein
MNIITKPRSIQLLLFFFLALADSYSQPADMLPDSSRNIIVGLNSSAFASLNFVYFSNQGCMSHNHRSGSYVGVELPVLISFNGEKNRAYKFFTGYRYGILGRGRFVLDGDISFFLMHHSSVLGNFIPVGYDMGLYPGIIINKSYLGLIVSWHSAVATHISHSEYSRECFNDIQNAGQLNNGPEDGWYANTASTMTYGLEYFTPLGSKLSIDLKAGLVDHISEYTGMLDAMMIGQIPFSFSVNLIYGL